MRLKEKRETLKHSFVLKSEIDSLAIGKFDGVHVAHRELFKRLSNKGGVLVIDNGLGDLTPFDEKQRLIEFPIFSCDFNSIKELDGKEFIKKIESEFSNLKKIVVGYDFMFGKDRKYCADDLKDLFSGEVEVVPEIKINGISVHSGIIREFIKNGNVEMAKKFLGREYLIAGKKINGQGIGKSKLVPTINIEVNGYLLPSEGVYVTKTEINNKQFGSVTFIGHRVSTDRNFAIETHILDEFLDSSDTIRIYFVKKLRDNHRYETISELKSQILKDIELAREVLYGCS